MTSLITAAKTFVADEEGITAIEYGLIAAAMVTAIVAALGILTPVLTTTFQAIADAITAAV